MRATDLLRAQFEQVHNVIEQVIDDCSEDTLTTVIEGGTIGSISAIYAHTVFDEDGWVAGVAGHDRLWETGDWSSKTGLEIPGHTS